jgi:WD40 repeat protein
MLWDMAGERDPRTLMGHEDVVTGLAFLREAPVLVSASADQTVRVWNVSMPEQLQPQMQHGVSVLAVSFSPDSRYLASVARGSSGVSGKSGVEQHTVKLWDVNTGTEINHALIGGISLSADVAFTPDGKFVAADDSTDILRFYTVPDLRDVSALAGHSARFSPDGRTVIYASANKIVRRGSPAAPEIGESTIGERTRKIIRFALSPDGGTVAASSEEDGGVTIHLWDTAASRWLGPLSGHVGRVRRLAFSPDGKTLASPGWDGQLGLWDVRERRNLAMLRGHNGGINGAAFSPDGRTLATCGDDAVRLWNVASRQQVTVLRTYAMMDDIAFSPDGQWLAAAANDGTIRLWHAPSASEK